MIELNNLTKKYDTFELKNITLDIFDDEYLVILGPSGAGKTVILELLAGIETADNGKIYGIKNKKIGFIYQDYLLFPHLNVFKNISYGLKVKNINKEKIKIQVIKVAKRLNITHLLDRDVATLSGGEAQRVAIARALIINPDIFLLDEPTSALDNNKKQEIQKLFTQIHKESKKCFIHVTHDFEEALMVADRIAVLEDGKIVQLDTPENIFNKPATKFVADFVGYQNVFHGKIKDNFFCSNNIAINVSIKESNNVYIAIKSNDIILSKTKINTSARNCFSGKVIEIIKKLSIVSVKTDIGIELQSDITQKSLEEMNLIVGDTIYNIFKTSSILIFEH